MAIITDPIFLYVEDDPKSRMVVKVMIERVLSYEQLIVFEDSQHFAKRILTLDPKPNVIFLDIQVTPIDGYQMLDILRHNGYEDTVVVAMTANVMSHDVEKLRAVGFDGLIGKPLLNDTFPQLVARILQGESVWYVP
jgi:two-component system cell cycle response regulator DivK